MTGLSLRKGPDLDPGQSLFGICGGHSDSGTDFPTPKRCSFSPVTLIPPMLHSNLHVNNTFYQKDERDKAESSDNVAVLFRKMENFGGKIVSLFLPFAPRMPSRE